MKIQLKDKNDNYVNITCKDYTIYTNFKTGERTLIIICNDESIIKYSMSTIDTTDIIE